MVKTGNVRFEDRPAAGSWFRFLLLKSWTCPLYGVKPGVKALSLVCHGFDEASAVGISVQSQDESFGGQTRHAVGIGNHNAGNGLHGRSVVQKIHHKDPGRHKHDSCGDEMERNKVGSNLEWGK